jgi:hypothetical protein
VSSLLQRLQELRDEISGKIRRTSDLPLGARIASAANEYEALVQYVEGKLQESDGIAENNIFQAGYYAAFEHILSKMRGET